MDYLSMIDTFWLENIIGGIMELEEYECADLVIERENLDLEILMAKSIYVGVMLICRLKENAEEIELAVSILSKKLWDAADRMDAAEFQGIITEAVDGMRNSFEKPVGDKFTNAAANISRYVLGFKKMNTLDKISNLVGIVNDFIN